MQSVPGQDELPQTFETTAEITARAEWNALRPRLTRPQELAIAEDPQDSIDKLFLLGLSTGLGAGAASLPVDQVFPLAPTTPLPAGVVQAVEVEQVFLAGTDANLKPGDVLLLVGKRANGTIKTLVRSVARAEAEPERKRTRVDFEHEATGAPPTPLSFIPLVLQMATITLGATTFDSTQVGTVIRQQTWREA